MEFTIRIREDFSGEKENLNPHIQYQKGSCEVGWRWATTSRCIYREEKMLTGANQLSDDLKVFWDSYSLGLWGRRYTYSLIHLYCNVEGMVLVIDGLFMHASAWCRNFDISRGDGILFCGFARSIATGESVITPSAPSAVHLFSQLGIRLKDQDSMPRTTFAL